MTTAIRAVRLGDRSIPVILPSVRDPRLHTAAVIISIHIIGITALGFRVSVPQILSAIVAAALIDVAFTLWGSGKLVWPASGMLTGSGVALILRLVGMESGNYWAWSGWYWFALVAGASVLTKYLVRYRGDHIFNPSNIGLVVAFLVIGSRVVEPLDFWWAPPGFWMTLAYVIIIGGGVLITRRLRLLEMAIVYWAFLAAGLGVLAASGHCMTAAWSPTPVCDGRFWSVLVTSPEILIFLFFMITDPKTIPSGRSSRVVFAATLALVTTLLIAPQTVEYGAKVGLLASLALWSPLRGVFARYFPDADTTHTGVGALLNRVGALPSRTALGRGMAIGVVLVVAATGIVIAGVPARDQAVAAVETVSELPVEIDPSTLPEVAVDDSVRRLDVTVDDRFVDLLAVTLAENLAIEGEAIRTADGSLLGLADGAERLDRMQAALDAAIATGERPVDRYMFDTLTLRLHEAPAGQASAGLVFEGAGKVERVLYDPMGTELSVGSETFQSSFVMRQLAGEHWLIVDVLPDSRSTTTN